MESEPPSAAVKTKKTKYHLASSAEFQENREKIYKETSVCVSQCVKTGE